MLKYTDYWVRVKDKLPEDGILVFTYSTTKKEVGHCQCLKSYVTEYGNYSEITHWMNVPELPNITEKEI